MSNLPAWDFLNDVNLAVDELEAQMARATSPEPTNQNELAAFDLEEYHEMGLPSNPNKKQETFPETTKKYHEYTLGIHPTCRKPEADEFISMYEECEYIALGTLLEVNAWFIRRLTVGLNHVIGPKLQYIKQKMAPHLEDVDYKRALPDDCPKLLDFRNKLKERWHTFIRDPSKPLSEEHRNLFAHREHQ
ncbi:hypothetical protein FQN53_007267 [Emmonsiellopsis sp. PD_33]|nr:hypothetical protein FQN53_007267 [Emmonsiellopsis sp. PD_33]